MIAATVGRVEYEARTAGLPLDVWNLPVVGDLYGQARYIVVHDSGGRVRAAWCCPIDNVGAAVREYRVLPYASPWVDRQLHPAKRDRAITALARQIQAETDHVDLPLSPTFSDTSGFLFAGFGVRLRHSRMLSRLDEEVRRAAYLPEVRGHIRAAAKHIAVSVVGVDEFDFNRAVVNQTPTALERRSASARALHAKGVALALNAVAGDGSVVGGIFLLRDRAVAISMHSWFDRGVRGVPSLLVDRAIDEARAAWEISAFDFEGSVLPGVDAFMSTFGSEAHPYGQLSWRAGVAAADPWTVA